MSPQTILQKKFRIPSDRTHEIRNLSFTFFHRLFYMEFTLPHLIIVNLTIIFANWYFRKANRLSLPCKRIPRDQ